MGMINGFSNNIRTIWNTCSSGNSIRLFHMETKSIHSKRVDGRIRAGFQEAGDDNYKAYRSTEENANRVKRYNKIVPIISRYSNQINKGERC